MQQRQDKIWFVKSTPAQIQVDYWDTNGLALSCTGRTSCTLQSNRTNQVQSIPLRFFKRLQNQQAPKEHKPILKTAYLSKRSSGSSKSDATAATASFRVNEAFKFHKYSICCAISSDVGSTGIVMNTKTFTARTKRDHLISTAA